MNTSSSRGSTSCQTSVPVARASAIACSQRRARSSAGDMQRAAEHRRGLDARRAAQPARGDVDARPGRLEGDQGRQSRDDLAARPCTTMRPFGEIDDARAALRLVHVVGRDQDGQAVARHVVDQVPELAPRLGVDAGGRLVEQQQLRLVQHAGGERQPLLPAAGQLPGELVAPVGQAHALDDRRDRLAPVGHLVDPRDEIQVLDDGQVFVEAEPLRHVADLRGGSAARSRRMSRPRQVPAPPSGVEQAAQHADRRRLAAAVGAEEAADLARRDLQRRARRPPSGRRSSCADRARR